MSDEYSPRRMLHVAKMVRTRARKLRDGKDLSPKMTATLLADAARGLEDAARHVGGLIVRAELAETRAEIAEAWRAGFEARAHNGT